MATNTISGTSMAAIVAIVVLVLAVMGFFFLFAGQGPDNARHADAQDKDRVEFNVSADNRGDDASASLRVQADR